MRRWLGRACLATCVGCIGRPVVGERDPDELVHDGTCEQDDLNCGDWGAPEKFPGFARDAFGASDNCSGKSMEMRLSGLDRIDDLALACGDLVLTLANDANAALARPSLPDTRVVIRSEGNARITIDALQGDRVSFALEGTATLRLRTLDGLTDLHVDAGSEGRGWDVEIEDSALARLAARTTPEASLLVRRSRLTDPTIDAGRMSLQNTTLDEPLVTAKSLIASGGDVMGGHLHARRGSFVGGSLTSTSLQGCESFLLDDTAVVRTDIGACAAAPMEIRNTTAELSILRDRVFALQSRFSECLFGAEEGASLSLFDSRIVWSLMCEIESLAARGGSVLFCARCDPAPPGAACIDEASAVAVVHCADLAEAPACDGALPDSLRELPAGDAGIGDASREP